MNVLSLFDGMSCGQIALNRIGITPDNYFASEIDKHAIEVTQKNYPSTIQVGDVQFLTKETFLNHKIDLIIGGSPCQGFSFAGKQLNFDDSRSKLFFDFVRLYKDLKEVNPDIKFLLENVKMKKDYQDIISKYLEVKPIEINSSLLSAQNRKRLYWTNIQGVSQPEDKGIFLKDILQPFVSDSFLMSEKWGVWWDKNLEFQLKKKYSAVNPDKAITMTARQYANWNGNFVFVGNSALVREATKKGYTEIKDKDCVDLTFIGSKTRRGRNMKEKSNCLTANNFNFFQFKNGTFRKLTPVECERLQTVPDNYSDIASNSQRYKMLGNGWTVDVIAHIFKNLKL